MFEQLLQVDPADLIIGAALPSATCAAAHTDARQFAAAIR